MRRTLAPPTASRDEGGTMKEKAREGRARRMAAGQGLTLRKSRVQMPNVDDHGGYRLVEMRRNAVVAGERFDLTLDEVEGWLAEGLVSA